MSTLSDFHMPRLLWPALVQLLRVSCPADLRELDLEERAAVEAELFLRSLTPGIRYGFLAALSALEVSARLRPSSRGKPFSRLDDDHARRHFESWWHAPSLGHAMAKAMKATVVMGFYELPEMRAKLAYAPDAWIAKVARRRMERYADEIRQHEELLFEPSPIAISLDPDPHDEATQHGNKATQHGNKATQHGNKATPHGNKATQRENKATPRENKTSPHENKASPHENKASPHENKASPHENKATQHAPKVMTGGPR